jgi:3-oxoacyl-ACP reductase-like protein
LDPWLGVGFDAWSLGVEATAVIGLRALKLAVGGAAAEAEAFRMVEEKFAAGLDLQVKAVSGALGYSPAAAAAKAVGHYRRRVRSNLRRLRKGAG